MNLVHKKMFKEVWEWAGVYRTTEKSIGIRPYRIAMEMGQLQQDMAFWGGQWPLSVIEVVARVHHRLIWIHPSGFIPLKIETESMLG